MQQINLSKRGCLSLFFLLSLVGALTGCGGSGSDAAEQGALSKPQFVQRAGIICKQTRDRFDREYNELAERSVGTSSAAKLDEQAKELVETVLLPAYGRAIAQIETLPAPSGDDRKVTAFTDALQRSLNQAEAQPLKFIRATNPFAEPVSRAKSYGLTVCAETLL